MPPELLPADLVPVAELRALVAELLPAVVRAAWFAVIYCQVNRSCCSYLLPGQSQLLQLFPGSCCLVAVDLVAVDLVAELLPGGRAAAWWPSTWWPVPVFVFVSTWCPVFVIRWPRSHTLDPRAPVRVAWAVGRVARFAGPGSRALRHK